MIPILLYHSIDNYAEPGFKKWTVSPDVFDLQIKYLHEAGYKSLTVTELSAYFRGQAEVNLPEKPIVITFDDGFADFYTNALPIFQKYEMTATLYIATKYIDGTSEWLAGLGEGNRPMLNWDEVAAIHEAGIECAPHTHSHPLLDLLDSAEAYDEIAKSKSLLEEALHTKMYSFAYPGGIYSKAVREMVIQQGFTSACAVKRNMSSLNDDPFALARLIVSDISIEAFVALLAGKDVLWPPYERLRNMGFRLSRQARKFLDNQNIR